MTLLDKPTQTAHFNIPTLGISDASFNRLAFGRQLDYVSKISKFKEEAKSTHFSAKGIPFNKALNSWKQLYRPTAFYCVCRDKDGLWKDDSIEVWYKD